MQEVVAVAVLSSMTTNTQIELVLQIRAQFTVVFVPTNATLELLVVQERDTPTPPL
jgi:hypothetical protein